MIKISDPIPIAQADKISIYSIEGGFIVSPVDFGTILYIVPSESETIYKRPSGPTTISVIQPNPVPNMISS